MEQALGFYICLNFLSYQTTYKIQNFGIMKCCKVCQFSYILYDDSCIFMVLLPYGRKYI